jgi:hypothetical protein
MNAHESTPPHGGGCALRQGTAKAAAPTGLNARFPLSGGLNARLPRLRLPSRPGSSARPPAGRQAAPRGCAARSAAPLLRRPLRAVALRRRSATGWTPATTFLSGGLAKQGGRASLGARGLPPPHPTAGREGGLWALGCPASDGSPGPRGARGATGRQPLRPASPAQATPSGTICKNPIC